MSGPWAATPQRSRPKVLRRIEVLRMLGRESATPARLSFVNPALSVEQVEKALADLTRLGLARGRKDGRFGLTGAGRAVWEMVDTALRVWL